MPRKSIRDKILNVFYAFIFCILAFYFVAPVAVSILASVYPHNNLIAVPINLDAKDITYVNYWEIFQPGAAGAYYPIPTGAQYFLPAFINTLIISIASTVGCLVLSSLSAYPLARLNIRGGQNFANFYLFIRMVPYWAIVIPLYILYLRYGLFDTIIGLIFIFIAFITPFDIFILKGYFETIPSELEDAARVDGCTRLGALARIILPLSIPGLMAVSIFTFVLTWCDFGIPLIFGSENARMLTVVISLFATRTQIEYGAMNAAAVAFIVPVLIIAIVFQRYIVSGLTRGALKG